MKIFNRFIQAISRLLKFFWIKYTPEHIARTLKINIEEIISKKQKDSNSIPLKNANFFEGELIFLSFFYFATISKAKNIYDNNFILLVEQHLSDICSNKDKVDFFREIIRNRFSLYKTIINENKNNSAEDIQNAFFILINKDIARQGYVPQNISDSDLAIVNPLERIFFSESLQKIINEINKILNNVKKFEKE
jgi:hypothetical protein